MGNLTGCRAGPGAKRVMGERRGRAGRATACTATPGTAGRTGGRASREPVDRGRAPPFGNPSNLPAALRTTQHPQRRVRRVTSEASPAVACCVYCDDAMLVNGLLTIGSFKRFAPGGRGVLFIRGGA